MHVMFWNFIARAGAEIVLAREEGEEGSRFAEVLLSTTQRCRPSRCEDSTPLRARRGRMPRPAEPSM